LQASLYAPENEAIFHVRLLSDGVAWETLLETAVAPGTWQDITIPLSEFEEQSVILRLENLGEGWWGNPRFTID
jgi:hypothetical protein